MAISGLWGKRPSQMMNLSNIGTWSFSMQQRRTGPPSLRADREWLVGDQHFAAKGENRLGIPIATLLGAAARTVTFYDEKFGLFRTIT